MKEEKEKARKNPPPLLILVFLKFCLFLRQFREGKGRRAEKRFERGIINIDTTTLKSNESINSLAPFLLIYLYFFFIIMIIIPPPLFPPRNLEFLSTLCTLFLPLRLYILTSSYIKIPPAAGAIFFNFSLTKLFYVTT